MDSVPRIDLEADTLEEEFVLRYIAARPVRVNSRRYGKQFVLELCFSADGLMCVDLGNTRCDGNVEAPI